MNKRTTMTFSDVLKNLFFVLIIIQIAPPIIQNIAKQYRHLIEQRTKVAVLPVKGLLYDSTLLVKRLKKIFEDSDIKALLIRMECPGGAGGTAQTIFSELKALKQENPKPVIVLVENMCASGGYNIAIAADYIIAPGSAVIGSIGATLPYLFNVKELLEQYKVKYTPIKAGAFKNAANPFVEMTAEEKSMLQAVTDDSYDQFIKEVSECRKLSLANSKEWAEGKIFTGRQAQKLGLIDQLGSLETAIKVIKEKAMIEGKIEWVYPPSRFSLWNFLGGQDVGSDQEETINASLSSRIASMIGYRFNPTTLG